MANVFEPTLNRKGRRKMATKKKKGKGKGGC